jgi:hypothetical protein
LPAGEFLASQQFFQSAAFSPAGEFFAGQQFCQSAAFSPVGGFLVAVRVFAHTLWVLCGYGSHAVVIKAWLAV